MDLPPRARVVFAALFLATQAILIATGPLRPDHAFAFRMFSESTTARIHLLRRTVDGNELSVDGGGWWTRDRRGAARRLAFTDYVDKPELSYFDAPLHASYGAGAELHRLQAALDYVVDHLGDDDRATVALIADVELRRGGGPARTVRLHSRVRSLDGAR